MTKPKLGLLVLLTLSACASPQPEFSPTGPDLKLAAGYSYKILIAEGDPMSDGNAFGSLNDMLAFVPIDATHTYLAVNHELRPGGMSVLNLEKKATGWQMVAGKKIDFKPVGGTWSNCSGNPTPWGTVLSAEESPPASPAEIPAEMIAAGFSADPLNYGWIVEVNPKTGEVFKRKAMGRFSHESAAVMPDQKTVYMGDDIRGGAFFKFVADKAGDLSSGTLYALDATNKKWIELPKNSLDNARASAIGLGATPFNRPEDVEYNPVDGMVYWAETGDNTKAGDERFGRVWKLNPTTLEMTVLVQGSLQGVSQPDNLTIEPGTGRVYIHEDRYGEFLSPTPNMPNNSLWIADLNGNLKRFASVPIGAEVTGGAFAPDGTFFFSVMHPNAPWKSSVIQVQK